MGGVVIGSGSGGNAVSPGTSSDRAGIYICYNSHIS